MIFRRETCCESVDGAGRHVDPARIEGGDVAAAGDQIERRASFRARFGQYQTARFKIERREILFAGKACARFLPMEAACDHQVYDEAGTALELQDQSLADVRYRPQPLTLDCTHGGIDAAQEKWVRDPDAR